VRILRQVLIVSLGTLPFLNAGPTLDSALDSLSSVHYFRNVAVSPDGSMAAWIETIRAKDGSNSQSASVWVKDLREASGTPRRIMESVESAHGLAWSQDGKLAFIATGDSGDQVQLYVSDKPGSAKPKKITNVQGYLEGPRWSPDGKRIALLWIEGATRTPGPTEATAPNTGVVDSKIDRDRESIGQGPARHHAGRHVRVRV